MKKESATIRKIAAAWERKLWGFYDLQKPFNSTSINRKKISDDGHVVKRVKIIEGCTVTIGNKTFLANATIIQ